MVGMLGKRHTGRSSAAGSLPSGASHNSLVDHQDAYSNGYDGALGSELLGLVALRALKPRTNQEETDSPKVFYGGMGVIEMEGSTVTNINPTGRNHGIPVGNVGDFFFYKHPRDTNSTDRAKVDSNLDGGSPHYGYIDHPYPNTTTLSPQMGIGIEQQMKYTQVKALTSHSSTQIQEESPPSVTTHIAPEEVHSPHIWLNQDLIYRNARSYQS